MNYLLAKKKKTNNTYYLVLTEETPIFKIPLDLKNPKNFDNNYKLEDDEWFGIKDFSQSNYSIQLVQQVFNSAEHHQIKNNEFKNIRFFCSVQEEEHYCFQRFSYSTVINKKWFNLTGEPILKTEQPIIIIKDIPDAIYVKSENTLYFKKLIDIKPIFPNVFELYKEATDTETKKFLDNNFIQLSNNFNKDDVKSANRKRIAMAQETLSKLKPKEKIQIHNYIKDYCPELNFDDQNNTFEVSSEETLKLLIFGIEQRFYTTIVGKEKRVANSISKI